MNETEENKLNEASNIVVGTRVTTQMYDALLNFLKLDSHLTVGEYVRGLLRRDLEQKGFLKTECPAT
jgi:hypothetical protein